MATSSGKTISGSRCINTTNVYAIDKWSDYIDAKRQYEKELEEYYNSIEMIETSDPPQPPEIQKPLRGLRIMKCEVKEHAELNKSPVESGYSICDNKILTPRRITITGICDNLRGELETVKDTRSKINLDVPPVGGAISSVANGIVDTVMGYEFETRQKILTTARKVYESIDKMYRQIEKDENDVEPKLYTISTKGMVYGNMVLVDVEQLTDAKHLLVIPVTLVFEELLMPGRDSTFPLNEQDSEMEMGGSLKKGNILEETWQSLTGNETLW